MAELQAGNGVAPISDIRGLGSAPVLLPGPARRIAVVLTCCCVVIVVTGAVLGAGRSRPDVLNRPVDSWIQAHIGAHYMALRLISDLGVLGAELTAVALALAALARHRRNLAALALISALLAWILTEFILKPLVAERIDNYFTYPSGHTQAVFCVATIIAVAALNPARTAPPTRLRVGLVAMMVAVGVAVAISMIGLNYHYFTDTVAGAATGIGVALGTALCLDASRPRRALRDPRLDTAEADTTGASCSPRPARPARS
jgi:membrane-associated phospholipid phosphatase